MHEHALDLIPIDATNWRTAASLKSAEDQQDFVAPNWYSLLEATYQPAMRPLLVEHAGEPIGFVMYGVAPEDELPWIYRLMVVPEQQGRGFGRQIMLRVIERIRSEHPHLPVCVSYEPENQRAEKLYASLGFTHHGEFIDGEKVVKLPAPSAPLGGESPAPFEEFLESYLRAWRECSLEELSALIAPDYQGREYTGSELVDFGYAESVEGWRQGFEFTGQSGAEWSLQPIQLLRLRPGEVLATISASLLQDGNALGTASLFFQTFRYEEESGWKLARSYIEAGVSR